MEPMAVWCALVATMGQESLAGRVQELFPTPDEDAWLQVGWRMDLGAARAEAARRKKPLFLWVMNGHPFGCT